MLEKQRASKKGGHLLTKGLPKCKEENRLELPAFDTAFYRVIQRGNQEKIDAKFRAGSSK